MRLAQMPAVTPQNMRPLAGTACVSDIEQDQQSSLQKSSQPAQDV